MIEPPKGPHVVYYITADQILGVMDYYSDRDLPSVWRDLFLATGLFLAEMQLGGTIPTCLLCEKTVTPYPSVIIVAIPFGNMSEKGQAVMWALCPECGKTDKSQEVTKALGADYPVNVIHHGSDKVH